MISRVPVWGCKPVAELREREPGAAVRNLLDRAIVRCGFEVSWRDWISPRWRLSDSGWRSSADGHSQQTQQDDAANPDQSDPSPVLRE
jgi:hypothetical protein